MFSFCWDLVICHRKYVYFLSSTLHFNWRFWCISFFFCNFKWKSCHTRWHCSVRTRPCLHRLSAWSPRMFRQLPTPFIATMGPWTSLWSRTAKAWCTYYGFASKLLSERRSGRNGFNNSILDCRVFTFGHATIVFNFGSAFWCFAPPFGCCHSNTRDAECVFIFYTGLLCSNVGTEQSHYGWAWNLR